MANPPFPGGGLTIAQRRTGEANRLAQAPDELLRDGFERAAVEFDVVEVNDGLRILDVRWRRVEGNKQVPTEGTDHAFRR
jgi:hypothetical protein